MEGSVYYNSSNEAKADCKIITFPCFITPMTAKHVLQEQVLEMTGNPILSMDLIKFYDVKRLPKSTPYAVTVFGIFNLYEIIQNLLEFVRLTTSNLYSKGKLM